MELKAALELCVGVCVMLYLVTSIVPFTWMVFVPLEDGIQLMIL